MPRDLSTNHRIHIMVEGKEYGIRHWANVPRRGEHILLKRHKENTFFIAKILRVTWGVAIDDADTHWPTVNLHCSEEK